MGLWFKSYAEDIPHEIVLNTRKTVLDLMETSVMQNAAKVAFTNFDTPMTYADFDRHSANFAAYLQTELGVKKGDRIAVMMPNMLAFPVALFGIIRCGAVQVNVNPMYTPDELKHQLNDAGVETIVIFSGSTPVLAEIVADTPVRNVLVTELSDAGGPALPSPPAAAIDGAIRFAEALETGASRTRTPVALTGDDTLFLQYTGGTTGPSKGAVLSHRNLVANTTQYRTFCDATIRPGEEVVLTVLPLYHIFALMVNLISFIELGGTNHIVTDPRDIDRILDLFENERPTVFTGVNTLYNALVSHPRLAKLDFSELRQCVGGGAAVMRATSDKWQAATGKPIYQGYGLSETSPVLTLNPFDSLEFSGCAGLPLPSTDIKLLKDDGSEAAHGEAGEICAKGPQVMSGYWNKPLANAEAFTEDGYFRTGDVGIFTDEGYVKIVDRKKDMVIVSGFNVYPNEVEDVISHMAGVSECACIGVPDEKTGEALRLFIVRTPDQALTVEAVIAHAREHLTAYKVPKNIVFLDALPKSTVGKILRRELRDYA